MTRLRKFHVTTGVFLVEAPEVGLSILCGCPGDVIKHLMRRGLIVEAETNGTRYETGPNAILLSDVMLQNGMFSNLGEFPVLQMLYLQGMLIPGHPNNRGQKPLLIGLPEQVETQLRYIHRGNYGLISTEEMIAAGATPAMADELMAMKLRFSFGRIRAPEELLDTVPLAGEPVVLRGAVEVRRLALNVFQFRLGDDTTTVDLNLPLDQHYPAPYTLGKYSVDRDYFSIVHAGDGDGWDPNRPCMSSMVMFQGRVYLIDAGPSLHHNLTALGISVNELDGIFQTHCHDDHFAGMTALLHADRRMKYFATPLVRAAVTKKFAALMNTGDDVFAHCFEPHDLELDVWNNIEGLEVRPFLSPHPVETNCLLFRAPWEGSYRSYAHFADLVSLRTLRSMRSNGTEPGVSEQFYEKVKVDYATFADVKKIDIGGGMIHGVVDDFRGDTSGKIVMAHTARELTVAEKEIGSGAPFGSVDVIISGDNHFAWRNAFEGLRTCFPHAPHHDIRMLLNSPLVIYNPELILMRQGQTVSHMFLVVTGMVDMFREGSPVNGQLSAGALIGDAAAINGGRATKTYRAASFVQALKISCDLFRQFAERNKLVGEILTIDERRDFLRSTWVCAEALTQSNLNRVARTMHEAAYATDQAIDTGGRLAFVKTGNLEVWVGDRITATLERGDFFGEEAAVPDFVEPVTLRTRGPVQIYLTDPDIVEHVPVMRWKLLEGYRKRAHGGLALSVTPIST